MVLLNPSSDSEPEGNPMVAGFQDEIDSDDDIGNQQSSQSAPTTKQDIELSSEEEENTHSRVQVVKYDDDYVTSDDEVPKSVNKLTENKTKAHSISSGSEKDMHLTIKPKANSMSSNSDKDISSESRRHKSRSPSLEHDKERNNASDSNLSVDTKTSGEIERKISSASSKSENSAILTNQNVPSKGSSNLANENSDSESDDPSCQVTVLQDADINPDDLGGADVFNDWLDKQEVRTRNEPQHEKINSMVSEQVQHKPVSAVTEDC